MVGNFVARVNGEGAANYAYICQKENLAEQSVFHVSGKEKVKSKRCFTDQNVSVIQRLVKQPVMRNWNGTLLL